MQKESAATRPPAVTEETCAKAVTTFDHAQAALIEGLMPLASETVPLSDAGGRVLAEAVHARVSSPRFDCAAMDGFAVRGDDLNTGGIFTVVEPVHAGHEGAKAVGPREAAPITTGAQLPRGADRVVPLEYCVSRGREVRIVGLASKKSHIRRQGSDFAIGTAVLRQGKLITPPALVTLSAADHTSTAVHRRPRVHLLSTGDEIVSPGQAMETGHSVPDSVSFAVSLLATEWGACVVGLSHAGDDPRLIAERYQSVSAEADVVVILGGASRGNRDFAKTALRHLGLELIFSEVMMKPGKPVWFGRAGASLVLGLPGNPTAALTIARLFLAPLLARLSGRPSTDALSWRQAPAADVVPPGGDREAFLCGFDLDGAVHIIERQEASAQAMLARATLLVRRPANAIAGAAGTVLLTLPF